LAISIIGYGEDFLTLWALKEKLGEILKQLGDNAAPADCIIFYRPSLGRRGLYGEFDAIVVSPSVAYLIESKWDRSNMPNEVLELKRAQILRHEILAWYCENWAEGDWDEFRRSHNQVFEQKFDKTIPSSQSLLGQNLRTILTTIRGRKLRNVLLYFYTRQLPKMVTDFEIVRVQYEPKLGNFVEIVV